MQDRSIVHLDLDTFFVSCERLLHPELDNKPVIIGGITGRGVVASASYEARKFGIYASMPMQLARQLCPDAIIIKGNSGIYSRYSTMVTDIVKENSPVYEKASFDEFFIDMSGMDRFFGSFQWATDLRKTIIRETGLPISFGLSTNKTVSKVGSNLAKPNGFLQVQSGTEKQFLAPLSIRYIPMVGDKTYYTLRNLGVKYVKTIQEIPMKFMQSAFGMNGISIWKKSMGIDETPIIPYKEKKSIGIERTFEHDTIDINKLRSILIAMAENLAFQLRNGHKLTSKVIVILRYADLSVHSRQKTIPFTAMDKVLISTATELFTKLYERRLRVRLIGIRFGSLVEGGYQMNLLEDTEENCNLHQAMDHLRKRFGQDAVKRVIAMGSRNIGRANPFTGEPPVIPAHRRA